jgi:hypothetical protein
MPQRTRRTARATASQKNQTATKRMPTSPNRTRPAEPVRRLWRITSARRPKKRRDTRRHANVACCLLRGAAYSTGSGLVGLLFWWLRLWVS